MACGLVLRLAKSQGPDVEACAEVQQQQCHLQPTLHVYWQYTAVQGWQWLRFLLFGSCS
jgi:hypothetical protein